MTRWNDDIELLRHGITCLFNNKLDDAEDTFKIGKEKVFNELDGDHDMRDSFALVYALVLVLKGIGSLSQDQLTECVVRLKDADSISCSIKDNWVGKKVCAVKYTGKEDIS